MKKISLKYILVGDVNVGKTSLLSSLTNEIHNDSYKPTIGIALKQYNCEYKNKKLNINIWDTAGQERYDSLSRMYYRNSHCVIFVFDLTNRTTFENLDIWMKKVKNEIGCKYHIIIIGNKIDVCNRKISFNEAKQFADNHNAKYCETSKLDSEKIKTIIEETLDKSLEIYDKSINFFIVKKNPEEKKNSYCEC